MYNMSMKKNVLVIICFVLMASSNFAQENNKNRPVISTEFKGQPDDAEPNAESLSLSVEEAVELAKKNNVSIAQGKITLAAALRAKNHSWNSISPTASLGASSSIPVDALSDNAQDAVLFEPRHDIAVGNGVHGEFYDGIVTRLGQDGGYAALHRAFAQEHLGCDFAA